MAGNDPSSGIHGDLLPHIHLVSTYRYPVMPQLNTQEVVKWLSNAPKIARDVAPFYWTYLDAPADGTIFLAWQPLARRNVEFSSDGYIWPQPEQTYRQDVGNGLYLEILVNKCGFRHGEPVAAHARRRFRLVAGPNSPQVDGGLWLVHYSQADKNDRLQTNMIQLPPQLQQNLGMRQQLLAMGAIVRKEFMLSDRVNWPHIPLPGRGNSMYAPPINSRGVPQTMAYPPQVHPGVGPQSKRRGVSQVAQGHPGQQPMIAGIPPPEFTFDDDEDTMKGDAFDHITPRDVSMQRYQQNHELMEEVLSSPYRMGQIVVADLGLGLRGELASLTEGIFESQGARALEEMPKKPYIGHLDPGLADEFRKRVNQKVDETNAEIEKMKADHEKRMAKLRNNAVVKHAEVELRSADTGVEGFNMWDTVQDDDAEDAPESWSAKQNKTMDQILAQVEAALGKHAVVVNQVTRVQEGGYLEPVPEPEPPVPPISEEVPPPAPVADATIAGIIPGPRSAMSRQPSQAGSQHSGVMIGDADIDMGGTAAGLLDQMHSGFSAASTPGNNFPTPQAHLSAPQSNVGTPANFNAPSPQRPQTDGPSDAPPAAPKTAPEDVTMEDADHSKPTGDTASDQGTGSGDWVVVPKHDATAAFQQQQPSAAGTPSAATGAAPTQQQPTSSKPGSAAPTPGGGAGTFDNNDFSSLGDLDTAGDGLAGYDPPSISASAGAGGLDMDMEDSAFGDAFHGVGVDQPSAGNTPAEGAF
ncbi:hypothetical protein GE09DRAFT_323622 [Coniochaeta sp. 2T2.1]|nr:hypothetical protein GE09DRAFT_323622 [Coniochaeta sp. 2T2.1]